MLRSEILCYMLPGICVFLPVASAVLSACARGGPDYKEVPTLRCALDGVSDYHCRASIFKTNLTLESSCGPAKAGVPLTTENRRTFDFSSVTAYDKSFKNPKFEHLFLPAVNVSLVTKLKQTTGFVVWFHVGDYDRCRYINVTNATDFQESLTVSYDCMHFNMNEVGAPFTITVTELPSHVRRTLNCLVPNRSNLRPVTIAEWESMICWELVKFEGKISAYVWFQTAPYKFGNVTYNISLYKDGKLFDSRTVNHVVQPQSGVEELEFDNLLAGNYSFKLLPLHPGCRTGCLTTTSSPFRISEAENGSDSGTDNLAIIISGVCVCAFICFIIGFILYFWRRKPSCSGASILLVYVHDRGNSHFELMKSFATLLRKQGFEVHFDVWDVQGEDPFKWALQKLVQANFVAIVWSEVALKRYTNTVTELDVGDEPNYFTSHLFKPILNHVLIRIKKSCSVVNPHPPTVCNIVWDKDTKRKIPDEFKLLYTFVLPKKLLRFTRYLNQDPVIKLPCEPWLPGESFTNCSDYNAFLSCFESYKLELCARQRTEVCIDGIEEEDDLYEPQPLLNLIDAAHLDSFADQGYESLPTDTNSSIQGANLSLEFEDNGASARIGAPHTDDDSHSLRDLDFINSNLA